MKLLAVLVAGMLIGLIGTYVFRAFFLTAPPLPANAYGQFIGTLDPTWLNDGRKMKLNHEFVYVDPNHKAWVAPAGAEIDGASIPQAFWSLIGGPFEGKYRNASVVHDVACDTRTQPSDEVHRMFYFACRCGGVEEVKAKAMYFAVLHYGPQWKTVEEVKMLDGHPITVSKAVNFVESRALSKDDAQAVLKYMETSNPDLPAIAALRLEGGQVEIAAPPQ